MVHMCMLMHNACLCRYVLAIGKNLCIVLAHINALTTSSSEMIYNYEIKII